MTNTKPWQIAVLLAALVVVGISVYFMVSRGETRVDFADTVVLVDVTNGDLFEYSVSGGRGVMVPHEHPDTGKRVLLPVRKTESGEWVLGPRERSALASVEGDPVAVDRNSGTVAVRNEQARRVR